VGRWIHNDAAAKFGDLHRMFGKPTSRANAPHGAAVWKDITGTELFGSPTCFKDVMLVDESVQHNCPMPHKDFLYMSVLLDLTPEERDQATRVSGSIWYDGLKKELTVRCGSVAANVATLFTVMQVLSGQITLEEVRDQGLYAQAITNAMDPDQAAQMHTGACAMVAARGDVALTGYYSGAFNAECGPPGAALAANTNANGVTTVNAVNGNQVNANANANRVNANANRVNANANRVNANANRVNGNAARLLVPVNANTARNVNGNANARPMILANGNAPLPSDMPVNLLPAPEAPANAGEEVESFYSYFADVRGGDYDNKFY